MNIIDIFARSEQFEQWMSTADKFSRQLLVGLSGSAKALAIAGLYQRKQQPILVVAPNLFHANLLLDDLQNILPDEQVLLFSVNDILAAEMATASPESQADRVAALSFLTAGEPGIVITSLAGFTRFLPSPQTWRQNELSFQVGGELELTTLPEKLVEMGYIRQAMVEKPGEFSIRGSIIDLYPLNTAYPVRLDLFDIEIDSIRYFEVDTQRSVEKIKQVEILPAKDLLVNQADRKQAAILLRKETEKRLAVCQDKKQAQAIERYFSDICDAWEAGESTENDAYYVDYLYGTKHSIIDYLKDTGYVLIDDYSRILETEREMLKDEAEWITMKLSEQEVFAEQKFTGDFRQLVKAIQQPVSFFSLFQKGMGNLRFQAVYPFQYRAMQQFFGQIPLLKTEMDRWQKQKQTVLVFVPEEERQKKMEQIFRDFAIQAVVSAADNLLIGETQITVGTLQNGFELPADKLVVLTEKDVLHTTTKKRTRRQTISNAERLKDYNELKPGDYVVHANHGIGKYIGMQTLEVDGVHQDYITILYQNADKLFIPVTQLDLIQKYVASEAKTPHINKLGGSEWTKTKNKVSAKIEDIADELLKLYAEREAEKGFAFSPDDAYQKEFEDAFAYSETEDQLRSAAEIKRDMEKSQPMDRLLVGDVGYGKTEVALRAAFKAIRDSKQVAFLVPTTVLAQQHYETMCERFANFPVEVAMLSRFRTASQQKATIEGIRRGTVDLVVGTHRLLSKDVVFQDLGLLVVDEEQRFGVRHKERLKQLKSQVDVLTLTATPIPRTLNMSMLGVRDLSVIETPPANRYPVQTYVIEQNPGVVREAIQRELARDGQVFYLYNRVETITQKVDELQQLVPEARVAYAHGQMSEIQLENILYDFIEGRYDVLVTTTIIETGVDIPNVNTLFVENADYMGLSQLYQLRGRVGRSNRVAYAYFMYQQQKILTEVSEKRLQAIKDFTELGSGFRIAMRDLSIRGAGNLLGSQQHGFIDAVGFDMYTQMLQDAVARKQGNDQREQKTVLEIDLGIDAYLPGTYITDERQKIEIYKRIRQLESQEMYEELESDLLDRFGEYPDEVAHLLTIGLIKMNGDLALLESMQRSGNKVKVVISKLGTRLYRVEQVIEALAATTLKADLGMDEDKMTIRFTLQDVANAAFWLEELLRFTSALRQQKYQTK